MSPRPAAGRGARPDPPRAGARHDIRGSVERDTSAAGTARLATAFDPRANSLNALRLLLACAVLFSHGWKFVLHEPDPVGQLPGGYDLGEISVDGFFVISGFLITRSRLRVGSGRFLWHRFLRIVPAFWTCLVVTAFLIAPVLWRLERDTFAGYPWLGADSAVLYVVANCAVRMNQFNIADLRGGTALDGSLHTLFFELLCYLLVAALGALGVIRRRRQVVLAGALVYTAAALVDAIARTDTLASPYILRWTGVFLVGSAMFLYAERVPLRRWPAAAAALLLVPALTVPHLYLVLAPVALGYALLYLGTSRRFAKVGLRRDLSYGIYIYAYPLQLLLLEAGGAGWGLPVYLAVSLAAAALAALLSWWLVEAPALSHRSAAVPSFLGRRARPATPGAPDEAATPPAPATRIPTA